MVEIIYTDKYGKEKGMLPWAEGDFTIGKNNTFELKISPDIGIEQDCYLMIEGTEYGGIVDNVDIDTTATYITVSGRTWHGLLEESPICPNSGSDYYVVSGDLNTVLGQIISRQDLSDCMMANPQASGYSVNNYQIYYSDAYSAIREMLKSAGCKLAIKYSGSERKAILSAVKRGEYVDDGIDGDAVNFQIKRTRPVNHLVTLGKGELKDRKRVDVYADSSGNVSTKQTLFGAQHKGEIYELSSTEDDKLLDEAKNKLKEYQADLSSCALKDVDGSKYDIDDIVGGKSTKHEVSATTTIAQKVATVSRNRLIEETKTEAEVV